MQNSRGNAEGNKRVASDIGILVEESASEFLCNCTIGTHTTWDNLIEAAPRCMYCLLSLKNKKAVVYKMKLTKSLRNLVHLEC